MRAHSQVCRKCITPNAKYENLLSAYFIHSNRPTHANSFIDAAQCSSLTSGPTSPSINCSPATYKNSEEKKPTQSIFRHYLLKFLSLHLYRSKTNSRKNIQFRPNVLNSEFQSKGKYINRSQQIHIIRKRRNHWKELVTKIITHILSSETEVQSKLQQSA